MSRVGLVLGGGGITGGAYTHAALLAIQMATGWDPADAAVIVGTSSGAFMAAQTRADKLAVEHFVGAAEDDDQLAERMRSQIYSGGSGSANWRRWMRHGILPGLTNPGLTLVLGSPARYTTDGMVEWISSQVGALADSWPLLPTIITAYDIEARSRVAFGTVDAPEVLLKDAVAASGAVPLLFHPHEIDGVAYVDGGVTSGTHADLVLGASEPLDLVIVIAPMASERGQGSRIYENVLDRVGRKALRAELDLIKKTWPNCDILPLRPGRGPLAEMRPNPMDASAAVPTFVRSLAAMRSKLAKPATWRILERHCAQPNGVDQSTGLR